VERGTVRIKRRAQEHNTMSPTRAWTRTARSGDERSNHEATAPPITCPKAELEIPSYLHPVYCFQSQRQGLPIRRNWTVIWLLNVRI